jgi:hypothetical protein
MSCVNHGSTRGLVGRFLGSKGTRIGGIYVMLAEENKGGGDFGEERELSC